MSTVARRHRRALFLRSLAALPIAALLVHGFVRPTAPDWTHLLTSALVAGLFLSIALLTAGKQPGSLPSRLVYRLFVLFALALVVPPRLAAVSNDALTLSGGVLLSGVLLDGILFGAELHLVTLIPRRPAGLRTWVVPLFYVAGLVLAGVSHLGFGTDAWTVLRPSLVTGVLIAKVLRSREALPAAHLLSGVLPRTLYAWTVLLLAGTGRPIPLAADEYLALLVLVPYPVSVFAVLRREGASRNRVLRRLIEDVQEAGSIDKLSRLVGENLKLAFQTEHDYVYFRDSRDSGFSSARPVGAGPVMEQIPSDYRILAIADRIGEPLSYPEDVGEPLPEAETEWLASLGAQLIVPIVESDGHLMGLLVLGRKRSEEPYTPADLELLRALANQIAIVHENLALQLRLREHERVRRRILDRLGGEKAQLVKECPACGFCFDVDEETCPRDGARLALDLPLERLIDGHYRLEQVLGRGGGSVVYLATDVRLDRGVAVKVLALSLLDNVIAPRRFEREARLSAQLLHPNIVTTHDFGKTKNGLPYIVLEHLEGETLRQLLRRSGPLAGEVAADWLSQVLDGLGAAHAVGVVHRDLKPDNVFIVKGLETEEEDVVKILDFGLAKVAVPSRDQNFTSPGTIMGTMSYMAPEQLSGRDAVDARTDLYSVGVIAYEAVAGKCPFEGRNPPQVLTSILKGDFELPDEPGVEALRAVLERCFQLKPERRYASAAALAKELIPALRSCPRLGSVKVA